MVIHFLCCRAFATANPNRPGEFGDALEKYDIDPMPRRFR
jgi:hypothetical protein